MTARLLGLTEPDGVVTSERIGSLAPGLFDYAILGSPSRSTRLREKHE
jgi:hypothetical protein